MDEIITFFLSVFVSSFILLGKERRQALFGAWTFCVSGL